MRTRKGPKFVKTQRNMAAEQIMQCPLCLETMSPPIIQCKVGHSMCGSCIKESGIKMCPTCREKLTTTRNYQLEQLIEGIKDVLKFDCAYQHKGCKFAVNKQDKENHERECKFRKFTCEGKRFAKWSCNWSGDYSEIYQHFKRDHKDNTRLEFKTDAVMKVSLKTSFNNVYLISLFSGQSYLYCKHRVDTSNKKIYFHFQFIGLKSQAQHYYYEFEVYKGTRKFKITEICTSDTSNIDITFAEEKCFVMSFIAVKNYLNEEGELPFKFRVMSTKKTSV
ncbi:E3 ubiquitin-protein ligase siah-1-like isoform X1 [Diabrotica virgifera virgifera]|uniref:E3 ubiquitin-protein ligase n=2 Tax=Diabrotica virgifera virgifera TaxID=50390 RepID=A0ABM5KWU3_DIAVI|nr:E3 ubiquitin-protein ligase siah-1-like isoform X1 [Diabrotica virgifera virgifera]